MQLTIGETVDQLHSALCDYIEATYHISHPFLVEQRKSLINVPGVIYQRPYIESTPRYMSGDTFANLGLPKSILDIYSIVSSSTGNLKALIHDPSYAHQALSIKKTLVENKSLVVMTGTGSGKTECFVLPILGKLAREAQQNGSKFGEQSGVRALVLYPMNALVNDQLGRLRLLFGDKRIVDKFIGWSGRPARFARYTSRTLYPGVRTEKKDQIRLKSIGTYYANYLEQQKNGGPEEQKFAQELIGKLKARGKWPSKPDLLAWYGSKGSRWKDKTTKEYKRCVTLPTDPELFTRHEVHEFPPDILVTNYSMLEYMLMRPLERPIFDRTKDWLKENPNERFMLVLDEAHLYRGAAGSEVSLLVRRLRARLEITEDRLQIICTSASFQNQRYAAEFAAQLCGKSKKDIETITGNLRLQKNENIGSLNDIHALLTVNLDRFYSAINDDQRLDEVRSFLKYRSVLNQDKLGPSLYDALENFQPMSKLINETMGTAKLADELSKGLFPNEDLKLGERAVNTLIALGSLARKEESSPGLLPCRVHSFFRGLAGLWVCMDSECEMLSKDKRGGPCGKMFSQPQDMCDCGARVLELYTCRTCGTAYARAYTDNIDQPNYLWSEQGGAFRTTSKYYEELEPLDLLLEQPINGNVESADYDLVTGRLNPNSIGKRTRKVYLRAKRSDVPFDEESEEKFQGRLGEFVPCGVCGERAGYGRSSVQDHQTKGDQPFQALISEQLQVQPPNAVPATKLAPLRGRKVLIFSDSRQTAARLAPNLQTYSTRDALRPLIISGYLRLQNSPLILSHLTLEDLYLAILISAEVMQVRLRPQLKPNESSEAEDLIARKLSQGALLDDSGLYNLWLDFKNEATPTPEAILRGILECLTSRYYNFESLALASIVEHPKHVSTIHNLPSIANVAVTPDQKTALVREWLGCWNKNKLLLKQMPREWIHNEIKACTGAFRGMNVRLIDSEARKEFKSWLPILLNIFTQKEDKNRFVLKGSQLTLLINGEWAYCTSCRTTQRPFPENKHCSNCGRETANLVDPNSDPVFTARKNYYRKSTIDAIGDSKKSPMVLIAAEHTAQLSAALSDEVFSKAEENELLFQDVNLGPDEKGRSRPSIDVLSCTTTMEVGIDIGSLSGVSLRNMPPVRANYQQRAGRAGRRGNALATVTAFGSADSHDEHYFSHPEEMISGPVDDPTLTLDNVDIIQRHVIAYLLQRYHQVKLPTIKPEDQPQLFAVLGSVSDFKRTTTTLNRNDFERWLKINESSLRNDIDNWVPSELKSKDRTELLTTFVNKTLNMIDDAIEFVPIESANAPADDSTMKNAAEVQDETDEEIPDADATKENLLDRLLYKGVLPRYAFPTDVASFYVFNNALSTRFRPIFQYTPSQGLPIALSQYAPGKQVWIGNKLWTSGAIYSPMNSLFEDWEKRRFYYECSNCRFARTLTLTQGSKGEERDCPACGREGTFGPGRYWLRPSGFAHPIDKAEGTTPDDQPAISYATRAKLEASTPSEQEKWKNLNNRLRISSMREHLLVTNRGPKEEGYTYCTKCGRIEPTSAPINALGMAHSKPFPDKDPNCPGGRTTTGMVLGTDFITDVLLISIAVDNPLTLTAGVLATDVVLRTVSEALTKAACTMLGLEVQELQAEFRPALTAHGREGKEAEIYIYDTLPGGAGFVRRVGELGLSVFEKALQLLENCPEACDRSCYRCIRSYKNKFDHHLLDRHLGASLIRYLLKGEYPAINKQRLEKSTDLLFEDLCRQNLPGISFKRNHSINVPVIGTVIAPIYVKREIGSEWIIGVHGSLTPGVFFDQKLSDVKEFCPTIPVIACDEIAIRRNLPSETSSIITKLR